MEKPLIGITSFSIVVPSPRSAVNQLYVDAIVAAGGAPILIPLGLDEESMERVFSMLDALLLPGGDDVAPEHYGEKPHPNLGYVDVHRDELELYLARRSMEECLPILGICRGIQVLAVAAGGTLYQDIPSELTGALRHDVREYSRDFLSHDISLAPASRIASILGCTVAKTNSFHHQAVKDVPHGFVTTARTADGVVEAIEANGDHFAIGVQCHPETLWASTAPTFANLFGAFVEAAGQSSRSLLSSA